MTALLLLLPAMAGAQDWGAVANVSTTMGINANRICVGEASRGDLGCPTYAPRLTEAGDVSVTGNLSAAKFYGDGSALTGVNTSVSVTTGLSGSLVFRDEYGSLQARSSLSISSTTGSVGIGAGAPAALGNNGLYTLGDIQSADTIRGTTLSLTGYAYFPTNAYLFWGNSTSIQARGSGGDPYMRISISSTEALRIVSTGMVGIGTANPSNTLHVDGAGATFRVRDSTSARSILLLPAGSSIDLDNQGSTLFRIGSGNVALATSGNKVAIGFNTTPSATLHVSGTALITSNTEIRGIVSTSALQLAENPGQSCNPSTYGAIKIVGGRLFVCKQTP